MHSLTICKYDWSSWWQTLTRSWNLKLDLIVFLSANAFFASNESLFLVFAIWQFRPRAISVVSVEKIKAKQATRELGYLTLDNEDIWRWRYFGYLTDLGYLTMGYLTRNCLDVWHCLDHDIVAVTKNQSGIWGSVVERNQIKRSQCLENKPVNRFVTFLHVLYENIFIYLQKHITFVVLCYADDSGDRIVYWAFLGWRQKTCLVVGPVGRSSH